MTIKVTSRGRKQKRDREMTPPGFYTRDQVRDRLELTEREIRKLAASQVLRTDRMTRAGYALYSEGQLHTLLNRKRDGSLFHFDADKIVTRPADANVGAYGAEDGVRVFELIERRTPLPHIAIMTGLHPRVVDQIRYDYDVLSGSMTIPKEHVDQMNALRRLPGRFPLRAPTDVLEVLTLADAERACPTCQKHSSAVECPGCIIHAFEAAKAAKNEVAAPPAHPGEKAPAKTNGAGVAAAKANGAGSARPAGSGGHPSTSVSSSTVTSSQ